MIVEAALVFSWFGVDGVVGDLAVKPVRESTESWADLHRCWVHRTANILNALPKRCHAEAKPAIQAVYLAATRADAIDRIDESLQASSSMAT
ncbi:MAG: hypothetical protein JJE47_01590 [Acidimicrobiia bacterium]|nr:hypothetical protein [Acidimicrobiia bacterium]